MPRRLDAEGARSTSARSPSATTWARRRAAPARAVRRASAARITLVEGDVTDAAAVGRALDEHGITNVVHLAALQVPFCRADPERGARVNVHGTVVVLEAVKARLNRIRGLAYASSTAVYNASDPSPAPESGGTEPSTLYGVFKLANEGTARVYWVDDDVAVDRDPAVRRLRPRAATRDSTSGPSVGDGRRGARRGPHDRLRRDGAVRLRAGRRPCLRARRAGERGGRARRELPGRARRRCRRSSTRSRPRRPPVAGKVFWEEGQLPFPESLAGQPPRAASRPASRTPRSPTACARRSSASARPLPSSSESTLAQLAVLEDERGVARRHLLDRVATHQRLSNGSWNPATRSHDGCSVDSRIDVAPAFRALVKTASTSAT